MLVEVLAIAATFVGGTALMRVCGLRGWGLAPLGFIAGTALYIGVGLVLLVSRAPTSPVWTMLVTGLVPVTLWVVLAIRKHDVWMSWKAAVASLAGLVAATMLLRVSNMLAWHADSHDYLGLGAELARGTFEDHPRESLLTARMLGIPLIHAPASLTNDYYVRAAVPLLALATFAAIVWFFWRGTKHLVDPRIVTLVTVVGVAFLLTSNRVIHHVFYINGHLMAGTFILTIAASAWLLATRSNGVEQRTLLALMVVCLPAVVVTRPEGAVMAAIAIMPLVLSATVPVRSRGMVMAALGLPMVVWFGYVLALLASKDYAYAWSTVGMFAVGVALCAAAVVLRWLPWFKTGFDARPRARLLGVAEVGLWVVLLGLTWRDPGLLQRSISATAKNQVVAGWGVTMLALGAFAILAAFMLRNQWTAYLRFPVTTFLPLVFLLAFMRDAAYRVGATDSLNRMWIQIVPLGVLYVMAAIALDRDSSESSNTADGGEAELRAEPAREPLEQ